MTNTRDEDEKAANKIARKIVTNWMKNQLRPEGRKGIYIDDEAVLGFEIKEVILGIYKEHAALTARCEKLERVLEAAKRMCDCRNNANQRALEEAIEAVEGCNAKS